MFAPADRPRVAVARDGSLAAFLVVRTVTAVELAGGTAISELDGELAARAIEIGWLDELLLVLSRDDDGAVVQVVDPWAADVVHELRLEGRQRLLATVGPHALVCGANTATVITHGASLAGHELPVLPVVAGALAGGFVFATDAEIVQWDPGARQATRRLPLARPAARIGGSPRAIWTCPQSDGARIDVVPLDAPDRPIAHQLPEAIARVASHPDADGLACLGESGALYLVSLLEPARTRTIPSAIEHPEAVAFVAPDRLLLARGATPIAIVDLDGRAVPPGLRAGAGWREAVVAWSRAVVAGAATSPPRALPIDLLLHRLELARDLGPAIAFLYGMHLGGSPGAAPSDLAKLGGDHWAEALGRGTLAEHRVAERVDSRIALAGAVQRALDELPPATGTLTGEVSARALAGPCVFVAPDDEPLASIAARCASALGGAILAAHDGAGFDELVLEARVRGAAPMVRLAARPELSTEPVIFVCADEQRADNLGIRRVSL